MSTSSQFAKSRDRWANELWNVSILPSPAANQVDLTQAALRLTPKNVDERRSETSSGRPLKVVSLSVSDTLD
jgi:hypothetical protein